MLRTASSPFDLRLCAVCCGPCGVGTYRTGSGILAALAATAIAAIALPVFAQLAFAFAKSDLTRAVIAFAALAAFAGYHAVHGITVATIPSSAWQIVVALLGAAIVAAAFPPAPGFVIFQAPPDRYFARMARPVQPI